MIYTEKSSAGLLPGFLHILPFDEAFCFIIAVSFIYQLNIKNLYTFTIKQSNVMECLSFYNALAVNYSVSNISRANATVM